MRNLLLVAALATSTTAYAAVPSNQVESIRASNEAIYFLTPKGETKTVLHCPILVDVEKDSTVLVKASSRTIRKDTRLVVSVDGKKENCKVKSILS